MKVLSALTLGQMAAMNIHASYVSGYQGIGIASPAGFPIP